MFLWKDVIEILFFSIGFYYTALWLSLDRQKNLLVPFYGYWFILFSSYLFEFPAITTVLLVSAPILTTLFVVMHQHSMQQNFVTLFKITPQILQTRVNWLDELIRATLYALNKQCNVTVVIEHTQSLEGYIQSPFRLQTDIQKGIFESFIHSHTSYDSTFFWITTSGKFITNNGSWNYNAHDVWFAKNTHDIPSWQQDALLFTSKTDALVVRSCFETHTLTVIAQGKIIENVSPTEAKTMINGLTTISGTKDFNHEKQYTKHSSEQSQS